MRVANRKYAVPKRVLKERLEILKGNHALITAVAGIPGKGQETPGKFWRLQPQEKYLKKISKDLLTPSAAFFADLDSNYPLSSGIKHEWLETKKDGSARVARPRKRALNWPLTHVN